MRNNNIVIKTTEYKLSTIKENYEEGKFKIPIYQRGYIWNSEQRGSLIDSLIKGYPIGTILVWYQNDIGYILDGQQRTRSLLKISKYPFKDLQIKTFIDITNEKLLEENENAIKNIIQRLSCLTIEELYWNPYVKDHQDNIILEKLKSIATSSKLYGVDIVDLSMSLNEYVEKLWKGDTFSIPSIDILKAPEQDAIEIFSRINTTGVELSKFEKLAAHWSIDKFKIKNPFLVKIIKNLYESHNEFSGLDHEIRETYQNTPGELIYSLLLSAITQTTIYKKVFFDPPQKNGIEFLNQGHLDKLLWFIRAIIYVEEIKNGTSEDEAYEIFNFDNEQDLKIGKFITKFINKDEEQNNLSEIIDILNDSMLDVERNIPLLFMKKSGTNDQASDYIFAGNSANLLISLAAQVYIEKSLNDNFHVSSKIQYHFLLEILEGRYSSATTQAMYTTIKELSYINEEADLKMIETRIDLIEEDQRNNTRISKGFSEDIKLIIAVAYSELRKNKVVKYHYDHVLPHAWLKRHNLSVGMNAMGNCGQLDAFSNYDKSDTFDLETMLSDELLKISNAFKNNVPYQEQYREMLLQLNINPSVEGLKEIYSFRWNLISKMFIDNIKVD